MLVSVILYTKNSEEFLSLALNDIEYQTYPEFEIIVVDNFSTDDSVKIANIYTDKVYLCGPERTSQASFGIKMAKGEYIWLTGSDMRTDPDYIEQAVKKLNEGYDAIYASVLTDRKVKHFWGRVKALERRSVIGTDKESARFFKKSVWEKLGGFDSSLVGFEEDFQHRLDYFGYKTSRITAREYHMHEDETLWKVFKKSLYYGTFAGHYLKKHKKRGCKFLLPIRPSREFLKHPILFLGLIIYKVVQYGGGLCGILRSQVVRGL